MSILDRWYVSPQNITTIDPFVSNAIPKIFNRIDPSFKHDWDNDTTRYLSFIRQLYTEFARLELGAIRIDQIISINTWYKGVFLSPAFPNILIVCLLGDGTPSQEGFINECGPLINPYNIKLAKVDSVNCLIMLDVPLKLYYPIINAFFRNDMRMRWPKPVTPKEPKLPRRKEINYYPSPFHNDTFRMLQHMYVKALKDLASRTFDINNISTVYRVTMETISNSLQYQYEHHIINSHNRSEIIKFFKIVKIFNQIAEHRFGRKTTNYDKIHFWIRRKYSNVRIYKILKYYDNDTLQWFLKYTNTFKYFDEWRIKRYEDEIRKQKEAKLKPKPKPEIIHLDDEPIYYTSHWDNSFPVIYSGDENIDRQLKSIVSTFIDNTY